MHDPDMRQHTTESDTESEEKLKEKKKKKKKKGWVGQIQHYMNIVPRPLSMPAPLSIRICSHNAASVSAKIQLQSFDRGGRGGGPPQTF